MSRLYSLLVILVVTVGVTLPGLAASQAAQTHESGSAPMHQRSVKRILSGNPKSGIYHNSSCRYFNCKACIARFASPAEAHDKGYRACKVCGG